METLKTIEISIDFLKYAYKSAEEENHFTSATEREAIIGVIEMAIHGAVRDQYISFNKGQEMIKKLNFVISEAGSFLCVEEL